MMKFAVTLLVLVAAVKGDEEGNFLVAGNEGDVDLIADSIDGDYFTVTRDVLYDPISAKEILLPTRMSRLSLNVGSICAACRPLLDIPTRVGAISGMIRILEIRYSRAGIVIRSVRVNPIGVTANSIGLQGGVGTNTATITITSRVSAGFDYRIQIHGQ